MHWVRLLASISSQLMCSQRASSGPTSCSSLLRVSKLCCKSSGMSSSFHQWFTSAPATRITTLGSSIDSLISIKAWRRMKAKLSSWIKQMEQKKSQVKSTQSYWVTKCHNFLTLLSEPDSQKSSSSAVKRRLFTMSFINKQLKWQTRTEANWEWRWIQRQ